MGKKNKTKGKSGSQAQTAMPDRKKLTIIAGVLVLVVVIAITAYVILIPGAGSASPAKPVITGTGTGAAARSGDSVSVYYTGMLANGTVFDSNVNATPITFTVGSHQVIKGFENAVIGLKAGQTTTVTIPVDQAYGPYNPENVHVLNRTGNLATMNLTEGEKLTYQDSTTGTVSVIKVVNFTSDKVTIDANSPLAGQPLTFTIQLVSVN